MKIKNSQAFNAFMESPEPSFKHTTYFHVYDSLLKDYRDKDITFVEIGVLNGGSLFMWRKFFGERARIIGIDLNTGARKWEKDGFEIYIGSQQDEKFWDKFIDEVGEVDIVLDDGGHSYLQQIITTEKMLGNIKDGGMIIVEDTHTSYMDGFGEKKYNFINYVFTLIHKINSRFGKFYPIQQDTRIFSIEVFESIVAFKVNKMNSSIISKPIWNKLPEKEKKAVPLNDKDLYESEENIEKRKLLLESFFSIHNNSG